MTGPKLLLILSLLILTCFLQPSSSLAQMPEQRVIVIYPAAEPQDKSLALSVFFVVTDPNGRPILRPKIESAEIQLIGANSLPLPATVEDPSTPFYIALVLDASGSMTPVIPSVREAAKTALDNPPPNARFAVIKFNDLPLAGVLRPIQDFTNDIVLVKSGIDTVESEPYAPTCLYNALYKSIELLDNAIKYPQERRAIILFTDGADERIDSMPCGQRSYDDVIYRATRPAAPITPIHIIGLCDDPSCNNIKTDELRRMAKETFAFSAVGSQDQLDRLFQEIMAGLNSQLVAKVKVLAHKEENQAALSIRLRDLESSLTTTFSFFSDRDYAAPPPPVEIQIMSVSYDAAQNVYRVALSISSFESVQQGIIQAWDNKLGQIPPDHPFDPATATAIELKPEGFEAGHEYVFRVLAADKQGNLFPGKEGKPYLAESEPVTYEPNLAKSINFSIESVTPNQDSNKLLINLTNIPDEGHIAKYEGFIVEADTSSRVFDFGPEVYQNSQLELNLPDALKQIQEPMKYNITIKLTTNDDFSSKAVTEFTALPPAQPGFFASIWLALRSNPIITFSIIIILLCAAIVIVYWNRPARKETLRPPLPRPPIDQTLAIPSSSINVPQPQPQSTKSRQTCLRLKVLQAPAPPLERDKLITTFPFVIGRNDSNFNIPDQRISRQHVEITLHEGKFFITDLESRNGTFIGEIRLPPRTPTPVNGSTVVRLGQQTRLELEPQ